MKQARKSGVIKGILNLEEGPHLRDWLVSHQLRPGD